MSKRTSEIMNGLGAIGITYATAPYWARRDGRPSLSISLWWVKFFILLNFTHITPYGHGSATSLYGVFWWPSINIKPKIHWSTLREGKL